MVNEGSHSVDRLQATLSKMEIAWGAIADAVVWIGEDRRVQWCNPAFERLVNQPQTSILGSPVECLLPLTQAGCPIPPDSYPNIRLQKGEYRVTEYEVQQQESSLVVEISGQYVELEDDAFILLAIRDVTQIKRVTAVHQQSEQEVLSVLRATLESTADGLLVVNQALDILVLNQKFVQMFSVPKSLLLPNRAQERLQFLANQTQDSERFISKVKELLHDSPEATVFDLLEMKDGRIFECYSQPLQQGNKIIGRVWSFRDITDYKRAEKALKRSELKFRRLYENSQVGIFRTRIEDGLFLDANQRCLELFGSRNAEEMIGCRHTTDFLVTPSDRELMLRELLPQGRLNNYEAQFRRQDGTTFWVLCSIHLNGEESCLDTVITDITDRKQAEEALQQSEAQFRALFETTNIAVMIVDEEGVIDCNDATEQLFGYSRQALLTMKPGDLSPPFQPNGQDSYSFAQKQIAQALCQGNHRFEWIHRRADGTDFPAEVWLTAVEVGDRKFIQAVVRDLTERKQLEAALAERVTLAAFRADIGTVLAQGDNLQVILAQCVKAVVKRLNASYAYIWTLNPEKNVLELQAGAEMYIHLDGHYSRIPIGSSLVELIAQERQPYLTNALSDNPNIPREEWVTREGLVSFAGYPLMLDQQLIGVMAMLARQPIPTSTFEALGFAASQVALGIGRKRVEAALTESEAKFRRMVENARDIVYTLKPDGTIVYTAPNVYSTLGYEPAELEGKPFMPLIHPDDSPCCVERINRLVTTGEEQPEREYRIRHKEGYWCWHTSTIALYPDVNGQLMVVAIARNISDRKQAEEALRLIVEGTAAKTGEEFFQSCVRYLVEVLQVRYAWVGEVANEAKTRVRTLAFWAGEGAGDVECDLYSEYDLQDTPCATVYEAKTTYYPQNLQTLFPNDPHLVAFDADSYLGMVLTDSSGHTLGHLAVLDVKPMKSDPGRELIMKIFASRAGAELERKQTEEKFVKAFRASPSPIAITNLSENRFIDVNSSFLKMCGYSLEEVIGHTSNELKLGVAEETYAKAIQQALETGALHNQDFKIRTKSGEVRTVLLSIELIDLAGIQCVLNIINDITERKRLENELISLVSHELRTPMTSLLGALDLLGSGQLGTLTPQGQQVLTIATNNTERLTRLVNDILDLERMKSGKVVMQKVKCNVADLMTQATEAMQAMAAKAQITLVTEPLSAELLADPDRIVQTLTNLLSNAIKFSKPASTVWLLAQLQSDAIEIQIKDQGRGIPEDKLQIIFHRFQQVDASDSRKKGGTGLGLAICRNIVEQHKGRIWVQSVLGQGSTFYISLPLLH